MRIKENISRLKAENYFYIVLPKKKICVELTDYEKALAYSKSFGGIMYNYYPYIEYGYEDPYIFAEEWTVLANYGDRVVYEVASGGTVQEVLIYELF